MDDASVNPPAARKETARVADGGAVGLWKAVAVALLGVLLTGAASWLVFGADKVTRSEMREAITDALAAGPWVRERGEVYKTLEQTTAAIGDLQVLVRDLTRNQSEAITEQRVLVNRVDTLVTELGRVRDTNGHK